MSYVDEVPKCEGWIGSALRSGQGRYVVRRQSVPERSPETDERTNERTSERDWTHCHCISHLGLSVPWASRRVTSLAPSLIVHSRESFFPSCSRESDRSRSLAGLRGSRVRKWLVVNKQSDFTKYTK